MELHSETPFTPTTLISGATALVLGGIFLTFFTQSDLSLPLINERRSSEFSRRDAKKRFLTDAKAIITSGFASGGNGFYMVTDKGVELVLSPKYANQIRNHKKLSFLKYSEETCHGKLPGFEVFRIDQRGKENDIAINAVKENLTQALDRMVQPLSEELENGLQKYWTDSSDWHHVLLHHTILQILGQMTARVFVGKELCRDPIWLEVITSITVHIFRSIEALRLWPKFLLPFIVRVDPSCRNVQHEVQKARATLTPVIEQRHKARNEDESTAIEWMEKCANGLPYDPAIAQLRLSIASMHTTSDFLTQVLFDICQHPGLIEDLRKEIIKVQETHSWGKQALYNLKLMDSVMKESQRLKPIALTSMARSAEEPIQLKNGPYIRKGDMVSVSSHNMWDDLVYTDSQNFNGYRFYNMRINEGRHIATQFVSTSPDHLGFGHGLHACPGRFFAATEVKVALSHILLNYDIKLVDTEKPQIHQFGTSLYTDALTHIAVRKRHSVK